MVSWLEAVRLVLIADGPSAPARGLVSVVEEVVAAVPSGAVLVLERERRPGLGGPDDLQRLQRLRELRRVTARHGAPLVVSSRADLATAVGAEGVQLPELGVAPTDVRRAFGSLAIGRSCHDRQGLIAAQEAGADWALLAPVWTPLSKAASSPPLGVEGFEAAIRGLALPIFALGGVRGDRVDGVMAAGAAGVACIGAILHADDPGESARALVRRAEGQPS